MAWQVKAAAAVVGTAFDIAGSRSKKKYTRKINRLNQDLVRIRNFQARREALSQFRGALAEATLSGYTGGMEGESSRSKGGEAQLASQYRLNVYESNLQSKIGNQIVRYTNKLGQAQDLQAMGQVVQSLGSLA